MKSLRAGRLNLRDSYVFIRNGEAILEGMHISPYEKGNIFNKDPLRDKRLLAHKKEIQKLQGKLTQKGYTLLPLEVYLTHGRVKLLIGLGKGKKLYDKRESIARKDMRRETEREFKVRNL